MSMSKKVQELAKLVLRSTTCYPKVELLSSTERYFLIKHKAHSSYLGRFSGSANCPVSYMIFDSENVDTGRGFQSISYGESYVWKKEGRLAKIDKIEINQKYGIIL